MTMTKEQKENLNLIQLQSLFEVTGLKVTYIYGKKEQEADEKFTSKDFSFKTSDKSLNAKLGKSYVRNLEIEQNFNNYSGPSQIMHLGPKMKHSKTSENKTHF